jgi:zinc and cadmium transporter
MLIEIILATIIVSLISLIGLVLAGNKIKNFLNYFIAFAAGSLIAASFFDLIPHALGEIDLEMGLVFVVIGIGLFFLIETFIHWHHCGQGESKHVHKKPTGVLIFSGDFVHNFVDGLLIAGAFMLDFTTGIVATLIVIIHEIPQEFGDFAVLLHSGYTKWQAVKINFVSALSAVLGGVLGYFAFDSMEAITPYAVLIAAGGFLYIALSDIIPELHGTHNKKKKFIEAGVFMLTLVVMRFFLEFMHGH